jgi:hypothetical protein
MNATQCETALTRTQLSVHTLSTFSVHTLILFPANGESGPMVTAPAAANELRSHSFIHSLIHSFIT